MTGAGLRERGSMIPAADSSNSTIRSPAITDHEEAETETDGTCGPRIETKMSGSRSDSSTESEGTGTFSA
jgi:hypothetical protein